MSPCHKRQPLILCNQKYHYTAAGLLFDWFEFSGLTKYKLQQIFCSEESNPVKLETSQTDSERVLVKIVYLTSEEAASVEASFPYPRGYPFETTWDFPACSLGSCKRPDAGFATHLMGLSQWRHVAACWPACCCLLAHSWVKWWTRRRASAEHSSEFGWSWTRGSPERKPCIIFVNGSYCLCFSFPLIGAISLADVDRFNSTVGENLFKPRTRVTRFGDTSLLWQQFKSLWEILEGL